MFSLHASVPTPATAAAAVAAEAVAAAKFCRDRDGALTPSEQSVNRFTCSTVHQTCNKKERGTVQYDTTGVKVSVGERERERPWR